MNPVYLDNNATTPVDPRVVEAMSPYWCERFGNPSSLSHFYGWEAQTGVDQARRRLAKLMAARKQHIAFTSGATESNNTILSAVCRASGPNKSHIITTSIEHKCVLNACRHLTDRGFETTVIDVDADGLVHPERISEALRPETCLVSVIAANNEIGTLQPIADIGRLCKTAGVLFHTDAAQLLGKLPIDVETHNIDFLSASSHKMYGPMGVGLIYARDMTPLQTFPLLNGGGQESGVRSGTLNVPGIVGFGEAAVVASEEMISESSRIERQKEHFVSVFLDKVAGAHVNGHRTQTLPGCVNLRVDGIDAMSLMERLRNDIAISSGSACNSSTQEPSHVLSAIGLTRAEAASSFRIGIGRFTSDDALEYALEKLIGQINNMSRSNEVAA